jgi:hypothetical protein
VPDREKSLGVFVKKNSDAADNQNMFIVIEFHDGKKEAFSFPVQSTNQIIEKMRLKEFMQSNYLVFSTDDDVLFFPIQAVRSIRLSRYNAITDIHSLLPLSSFKNAERI